MGAISVFLVLSATKDLLLALREEVLWEDLVVRRVWMGLLITFWDYPWWWKLGMDLSLDRADVTYNTSFFPPTDMKNFIRIRFSYKNRFLEAAPGLSHLQSIVQNLVLRSGSPQEKGGWEMWSLLLGGHMPTSKFCYYGGFSVLQRALFLFIFAWLLG